MRIVQSDGTAGSPAPSSLLSFSPKLSKSRSVFAPLSKSSFYFSLNSSKKEKKKRKEKEQTLPSFPHRPRLHFLPKAGAVGGTPVLPPDPGIQVTNRPGAEKGRGRGRGGTGRGGGHPGQRSWGLKVPHLSCARPGTRSVQGMGATPFWIFQAVRLSPGHALPPLSPPLQEVPGKPALTQDIFAS